MDDYTRNVYVRKNYKGYCMPPAEFEKLFKDIPILNSASCLKLSSIFISVFLRPVRKRLHPLSKHIMEGK